MLIFRAWATCGYLRQNSKFSQLFSAAIFLLKPKIMLGHNVIYVDTICLCDLHGWSSDSHQPLFQEPIISIAPRECSYKGACIPAFVPSYFHHHGDYISAENFFFSPPPPPPPATISSFSKQIWVVPYLNPSKVFSDSPFWVLSYDWCPFFSPQNQVIPPKILPPLPQAIINDRSLRCALWAIACARVFQVTKCTGVSRQMLFVCSFFFLAGQKNWNLWNRTVYTGSDKKD